MEITEENKERLVLLVQGGICLLILVLEVLKDLREQKKARKKAAKKNARLEEKLAKKEYKWKERLMNQKYKRVYENARRAG